MPRQPRVGVDHMARKTAGQVDTVIAGAAKSLHFGLYPTWHSQSYWGLRLFPQPLLKSFSLQQILLSSVWKNGAYMSSNYWGSEVPHLNAGSGTYSKHVARLLHCSLAVLPWGMDEMVHREDSFLLVLSECSQSYLAILKLLLRSLPKVMHRGRPGICNCHLKVK